MASILTPITPAPTTATDFVGLAELRSRAGTDAKSVTPEAARQFEALFVQMMLKSMREAGDVFGDGSDTTYRDMFDQQIAMEMTKGKGLGLADVLTRQLTPAASQAAAAGVTGQGAPAPVTAPPNLQLSPMALRFQVTRTDPLALADAAAQTTLGPETPAATDSSWGNWKPATPEEFIRDIWPHAQQAGQALGVDPRAIVAQAALETGWGRSLARDGQGTNGNNPFNIKADASWSGQRVSVRSLEFEDGLPQQKTAAFRAYPDLKSAFTDYVQFLKGNPRYADALRNGASAEKFADSLQSAGYATDPGYANKLRSILGGSRLNGLLGQFKNLARLPIP